MPNTNESVLSHLATRRSIPAMRLVAPAPTAREIDTMLTIAARVPDHGKLAPWRFILFEGEARKAWLERLMEIWRRQYPDAPTEAETVERGKIGGAPLVMAVVSRAGEHPKIPVWEQELSAGAVAMNLVHAAHALGYAAQWLTGWPAYDAKALALIGVGEGERVAGLVHIGTPADPPSERDRPDVAALTTRWVG